MLVLSDQIINKDLLSIRTASKVGSVSLPIINPASLHIDAFYCQSIIGEQLVLLDTEIRELSRKGFIIDDINKLSSAEELLRLKPIIEMNYILIGKKVFSNNKYIGKVRDFIVDTKSLYVQKLLVANLFGKIIDSDKRVISRDQIIEVTDSAIHISGPEETVKYQLFNKAGMPSSAD